MRDYSWSMIANASRSILNWLTIKIILMNGSLGTLGIWGQLQNISSINSSIVNFSSSTAVTKGIANKETFVVEKVTQLSIIGSIILLVIIIGSTLFKLDGFDMGSPISIYFLSIALGINAILQSIMIAEGEFKKIFKANLVAYSILPLVLIISDNFELNTFIYALLVGVFTSNVYLIKKISYEVNISTLTKLFPLSDYTNIILIGASSFANVVAFNYVIYHSRSLLDFGMEIDSYEVLIRTFMILESFLITPLTILLWRKVSKLNGDRARKKQTLEMVGQVSLLAIGSSVFIYFSRDYFIELVFSSNLYLVNDYLYVSLLILIIKSVASIFVASLLLRNLQRICIINDIIFVFSFLVVISILNNGLKEIILSILISYVIYLIWPMLSFIRFYLRDI